jgi:hypothetical protein
VLWGSRLRFGVTVLEAKDVGRFGVGWENRFVEGFESFSWVGCGEVRRVFARALG